MLVNCSVCLEDINLLKKEVSILKCGHFFHTDCLNNWLKQQLNRPECRDTVKKGTFPTNIYPKLNQGTAVTQLKDDYDELRKENVLLKKTISSQIEKVSQTKRLEDECDELLNENISLKKNILLKEQLLKKFISSLKENNSQLKSLKDECNELRRKNDFLITENSSYKKTVSRLRNLEDDYSNLQNELFETEDRLDELQCKTFFSDLEKLSLKEG